MTSASVLEATQKSRPTDKRCRRTHHCRCCPCAIAHPAPGCRARPHRSRHNAGSACAWASAVALGRKMLVKTLPCNMLRRATRSVARKPRPAAAGQGAQCGSSVSDGTRRTKSRPRLLPSRQRSHKRRPRHGEGCQGQQSPDGVLGVWGHGDAHPVALTTPQCSPRSVGLQLFNEHMELDEGEPCSTAPASSAWKASCRSGKTPTYPRADHPHDLARLQCCSAMDLQSIIRNCPANDIGPITLKELPTSLATGSVLASVLFKPKLP